MALEWKLVVDAADPHRVAAFWAEALGYEIEDNTALIDALLGYGTITEDMVKEMEIGSEPRRVWRDLIAVRHPDDPYDKDTGTGLGRRILFQRVPEPKTVKNRLHIDVHTASDELEGEAARLETLGATVQRHIREPAGEWIVMTDPEGNEFCVH